MKNYLSLEERKRKLIEDCCGGMGGDMGGGMDDSGGMSGMETDPQPAFDDTKKDKLSKYLKKKRRK